MNTALRGIVLFIAQGAFAGRSPVAPGTAGTVIGVLLYSGMKNLAPGAYLSFTVLICLLGIWAAGRAEKLLGCVDCPSIVIDEIAGYLVAMCLLPSSWQFMAAGFVLFRAFDILKPWPLKRLQDLHGGAGVMLDDIGAGAYTNIVLQAAAVMVHQQ